MTKKQIDDSLQRPLATYTGVKCCVCLHKTAGYLYLLKRVSQRECRIIFLGNETCCTGHYQEPWLIELELGHGMRLLTA